MYKFLINNGVAAAFGLGVLLTIIFLASVFMGLDAFNALPKEEKLHESLFDIGLYCVIALTVICFIAMIGFGIVHVAGDLKGSMKGLLGFVAILAFFFITKSMYDGNPTGGVAAALEKFHITDGQSSFISGAISTALMMCGAAVIATVVSLLSNFVKR